LLYRRVTIRLSEPVFIQIRENARLLGWQLADFQRTLICLGATLFLLSYDNEAGREAIAAMMGGMKLLRMTRSLSLHPKPHRRPYALRLRLRRSTLTTLGLPESVRELISTYATLKHVTPNQVYGKCLQQGLLAYLKAHETALTEVSRKKPSAQPISAVEDQKSNAPKRESSLASINRERSDLQSL